MAVLKTFRYRFWDVPLAVVNCPYRRKQFAPQHILVKVTLRAEGQGPPDATFIIQCADDNETRLRYFLSERAEDLFSGSDRQIPVQERDIGPKVPELLDGLPAITRLKHARPCTRSRPTARLPREFSEAVCRRPSLVRAGVVRGAGQRPGWAGPAQRHILRLMPERPPNAAWLKLGAEPGLCGACRHAKLNETQRGTAYLRCTRAAWDITLSRYPRLPVTQCAGLERHEEKP